MPTSCGNCASMMDVQLHGFNGNIGRCWRYQMWRRVDIPTLDCPHWESDAEVRAELLGEEPHNPAVCGQCVCYNALVRKGPDGDMIMDHRQGSCTPVGVRSPAARACHRFFPTVQLDAEAPGWDISRFSK